jgi:hypothetical protein
MEHHFQGCKENKNVGYPVALVFRRDEGMEGIGLEAKLGIRYRQTDVVVLAEGE